MESGGSSEPAGDDLNLWLEVSGGQKKGRTIGAGTVGDPRYVLIGESSSSHSYAAGPSAQVDHLRTQLEETQALLTEEQAIRIALQRSVDDMQNRYNEERSAREQFEEAAREREQRAEEERAELRRMMQEMMKSRHDPPQ